MAKLSIAEIRYYLEEARSCEERQKYELQKRNNYPFLINYYEGIEKINPTSDYISSAEVYSIINEYFPNTNSLISEIIYQNPDISAEATKPPDMAMAQKFIESFPLDTGISPDMVMASSLSFAFKKLDALAENRVALFDMIYAGYGCVEVDHLKEDDGYSMLPDENKERQGLMGTLFGKAKEAIGMKEAEEKIEAEEATQEEKYATPEKTFIRRWHPLNVPLDWKADTLKDRRYNLKKCWYSKAEFDSKYPEFKDKVYPSDEKDSAITYAKHSSALYNKRILLYEFQIRHKKNQYMNLVISPQYTNSEIDYYPRPYPTNGFNMKIGTLHKYGKLYPISFAQINKKIQDEMNEYIRFMMKVAEHNIPKNVVDKNKVKADGDSALRSNIINDSIYVDGNPQNAVVPLQPTNISVENKELIAIFKQQKEKQWNVSEARLAGKGDAKFMGELEIQEAGFQSSKGDIQEGLKDLILQELETLKDIEVVFWDAEYFFKVTGGQKPQWYIPKTAVNPQTGQPMVLNALTDILTSDYELSIDITSSLRPNKERKKREMIDYLKWIVEPNTFAYLQSQGKTVNIEEFKKSAQQFGFNPETIFIDLPKPEIPPEMALNPALPPQGGVIPEGAIPNA